MVGVLRCRVRSWAPASATRLYFYIKIKHIPPTLGDRAAYCTEKW